MMRFLILCKQTVNVQDPAHSLIDLLLLFVCLATGHSLFQTKSSFGERDCSGKVIMW
jgi:hypothetical protein